MEPDVPQEPPTTTVPADTPIIPVVIEPVPEPATITPNETAIEMPTETTVEPRILPDITALESENVMLDTTSESAPESAPAETVDTAPPPEPNTLPATLRPETIETEQPAAPAEPVTELQPLPPAETNEAVPPAPLPRIYTDEDRRKSLEKKRKKKEEKIALILAAAREKGFISIARARKVAKLKRTTAQTYLRLLVSRGLMRRIGNGKKKRYEVMK